MAYTTAESRQELLDELAAAADELGLALACVGEAHAQMDDVSADKIEVELFKPVQSAYGRAKRTHSEFAGRHGMPGRTFVSPTAGLPSKGAAGFLQEAVSAVGRADIGLGELQDSMLPVEAGDAELRAGLTAIRDGIAGLAERSRDFLRGFGR